MVLPYSEADDVPDTRHSLNGRWLFRTDAADAGVRERWFAESWAADAGARPIDVPAPWERSGYEDYDGAGWYQRAFELPAGPASGLATIWPSLTRIFVKSAGRPEPLNSVPPAVSSALLTVSPFFVPRTRNSRPKQAAARSL